MPSTAGAPCYGVAVAQRDRIGVAACEVKGQRFPLQDELPSLNL